MFRFTIRELALLMLVVGLAVEWWVNHRSSANFQRKQRDALEESELRIKHLEGLKQSVTKAQIEEAPLTLAVSTVGLFSKGKSWHLSVNPAGEANLTIEGVPKHTHRRFDLSQEQMAELREMLVEEQFFELAGHYGEIVPGGSERSLTVAAGRYRNTVKIRYLTNLIETDKVNLRESGRALRLLVLVQGWIDDSEAVDLRKYDRLILDAIN